MAAQMWPKCGPNAARMWPEFKILWPVINPWTFPVARARPEPKPQAQNPARTMKKVARPSPTKMDQTFLDNVNLECKQNSIFFPDHQRLFQKCASSSIPFLLCVLSPDPQ